MKYKNQLFLLALEKIIFFYYLAHSSQSHKAYAESELLCMNPLG